MKPLCIRKFMTSIPPSTFLLVQRIADIRPLDVRPVIQLEPGPLPFSTRLPSTTLPLT